MTTILRKLSVLAQAEGNDPTRTRALRDAFATEVTKRLRRIRAAIIREVMTEDAFGLASQNIPGNLTVNAGRYQFLTTPQKHKAFMGWLEELTQRELLSTSRGPAMISSGTGAWSDIYVQAAYKQGLMRGIREAELEARRAGKAPRIVLPKLLAGASSPDRAVDAMLMGPIHADRLASLYNRTFTELKGITNELDTAISRTLSQGLAEGRSPRQLARILARTVEIPAIEAADAGGAGRRFSSVQRARMMARTEVVRAHHTGLINTYRQAGVEKVKVKAEWKTAGDDKVCPRCAKLEGKVYSLDEIEPLIPLHPNCRCVALPVIDDEVPGIKKAGTPAMKMPPDLKPRVPRRRQAAPLPPLRVPPRAPARAIAPPSPADVIRKGRVVGRLEKPSVTPPPALTPPVKQVRNTFTAPLRSGSPATAKRLHDNNVGETYRATINSGASSVEVLAKIDEVIPKGWEGPHASVVGDVAFTPGMREEAAFKLSRQVGFGNVPPTVYRDATLPNGVTGKMSMQQWVDDATTPYKAAMGKNAFAPDGVFAKLDPVQEFDNAIFDALLNHRDRHAKNWMIRGQETVLIDNGYSFAPYVNAPTRNERFQDLVETVTGGYGTGTFAGIKKEVMITLRKRAEELYDRLDALDVEQFFKSTGFATKEVTRKALEQRRQALMALLKDEDYNSTKDRLSDLYNARRELRPKGVKP